MEWQKQLMVSHCCHYQTHKIKHTKNIRYLSLSNSSDLQLKKLLLSPKNDSLTQVCIDPMISITTEKEENTIILFECLVSCLVGWKHACCSNMRIKLFWLSDTSIFYFEKRHFKLNKLLIINSFQEDRKKYRWISNIISRR